MITEGVWTFALVIRNQVARTSGLRSNWRWISRLSCCVNLLDFSCLWIEVPIEESCVSCVCGGDLGYSRGIYVGILDIEVEWYWSMAIGAMYAWALLSPAVFHLYCCKATPRTFLFWLWISDSSSLLKLNLKIKLKYFNCGLKSTRRTFINSQQKTLYCIVFIEMLYIKPACTNVFYHIDRMRI